MEAVNRIQINKHRIISTDVEKSLDELNIP
jgi:hypothetical protein